MWLPAEPVWPFSSGVLHSTFLNDLPSGHSDVNNSSYPSLTSEHRLHDPPIHHVSATRPTEPGLPGIRADDMSPEGICTLLRRLSSVSCSGHLNNQLCSVDSAIEVRPPSRRRVDPRTAQVLPHPDTSTPRVFSDRPQVPSSCVPGSQTNRTAINQLFVSTQLI